MEFRPIPGSVDSYVSGSDGLIYSNKSGRLRPLTGSLDGKKNYLQLWFYPDDGTRRRTKGVHVMVCGAFHGPRPTNKHTASHINGVSTDNRPENLKWEPYSDNLRRKLGHGTHDRGLNNSRSCMTPELLSEIRDRLSRAETCQAIADSVGISRTMISRIKTGAKYADF